MIYFDYAATSIIRKEIFEYVYKNLSSFDGNTESIHSYGRQAREVLEDARAQIARSIKAPEKNIFFNSGASEGNNTIIRMFEPAEILTTTIEHSSVQNNIGDSSVRIPIDKSGIINIDSLIEGIKPNTRLITIQYVNNEVGTIQPVREIGEILSKHYPHIWYHIDAVQAYGHLDIIVDDIKCTSLSISSHKIGATKNFGILYSKENFNPLVKAGDQEHGRRGGTGNPIGAYAMAHAYNCIMDEGSKIYEIKKHFLECLENSSILYEINGDVNYQSNHILNIYFPDFKTDFLLTYLDMHGICVSSGSACKSGSHVPSRVVKNMYNLDRAEHSIRFSFGYMNTLEDVEKTIEILGDIK